MTDWEEPPPLQPTRTRLAIVIAGVMILVVVGLVAVLLLCADRL